MMPQFVDDDLQKQKDYRVYVKRKKKDTLQAGEALSTPSFRSCGPV